MKTRIIVNGAKGKMGKTIIACATNHPNIEVVGTIDADSSGYLRGLIPRVNPDVIVDFSSHTATSDLVALCAGHRLEMVIGTTGHTDTEKADIMENAAVIPIVMASNFSTGVNALFWLTGKVAEILGQGFDLEIVEMHHRLKKDAPSGTAHTLAKILAEVRARRLDEVVRNGRAGIVSARTAEEIGIHSIRGGDVVGDHTVMFLADGERLELTHKASSRETFARGAFRAVEWIIKQPPGLYDMMDVLGLK